MQRTEMRRSAVVSTRAGDVTVYPKPIPRQSAKTKARQPERVACREAVFERDDHHCVGDGIDGVPHDHPQGVTLCAPECHELRRGQMRGTDQYLPDWCLCVCHCVNDWVAQHPKLAQSCGLALPSWATDPDQARQRRLLAGGVR